MGSCISNDSGAEDSPPTAKVIPPAGALREYPSHLTAADVLAGDCASCFLCSSDELFYDDYIPPMDPEEPLRPGQLYFVLPAAMLRYPLSGSDMKELVVKASSALASEKDARKKRRTEKKVRILPILLEVDGSQQGGGGGGDVDEVRKFDGEVSRVRRSVMVHGKIKRSGSVQRRVGTRRRCPSPARLSAIPEVAEELSNRERD